MILKRLYFLLAILFFGSIQSGRAQGSFRVIGGIPHLPVTDVANIAPEAGMIIFEVTTRRPLVYSGSAWKSLCAIDLIGAQPVSSFKTVDGIPSLPVLSSDPSGPSPAGAVYYSTSRQRIMVFSGTAWRTLTDLRSVSGVLPVSTGFGTSASLQISRIPVLAADPFPIGLSDGAFYLSSVTRSIRYYADGTWQDLNCSPIETLNPSGVTNSSFTSGIRILSDGLSFSETGICWSKSLDPVYSLPTKLAFSGSIPDIGELPLTVINNLDANTLYYVRAYAVLQNSGEVIYGENKSLTTDLATFPTIVTLDWKPAKLKPISSEGGGDIIRDGGARVNQRGVIYSELPEPKSDPNPVITIDGSGVGRFDSKMTPLKANTRYYYRAYADNVVKGRGYGDPVYWFETPGPTPPELSPSIVISNITDVSASTKVTILNNGGAEVRERGVSWSKTPVAASDWRLNHPDIDYESSQTVSAFDIGTFDCQLLRLEPGQRYYVRTYARNDIGTSFSSETAFDATGLPTINTLPLDEQATTGKTATGAGEVISTGASPLIQRGFIWSKTEAFDPATETDTIMTVLPIEMNASGTGLFYGLRQELEPGTTYYYCAYAKNNFGTNYGDVLAFTTAARPTVITDPAFSQITATSATGGGNVTNDGGEPVLYKGLSWNRDPLNPEPNEYVLYGNGTGPFFSAISGLRANTKYYVRAFGTNSVGPGYGSPVELNTGAPVAATVHTYHINNTSGTSVPAGGYILNDGGSDVTERGFCWNTTGVPTVNDNKVSGGTGTGRFDLMIAGLQSEKTYYVRAYAITDAPLPSYGNEVSFKTITKPTVFTKTDVTVTGTRATVSGDIVSDGGSRVSRSGIVWDLEDEPEISLPTRVQSGTGMGEFNHSIGELLGNSTYFYRAYATNEVGTAYGYSRILKTPPPVKPTVKTLPVKNITAISGLGGGEIISHGGALLVETGLVWSTVRNFIPEDVVNERTRQTDSGTFTSLITGLQPGVKYYVCAYAKNAAGLIAYGDPIEFTTWNYALVKTGDIISKTNVSAIGHGEVLNNGGTAVTRNGLVWAEHEEPTINDFVSSPPGSGVGTFTANLTNLYGNTTYHVRAFAINSAGVAYGPEKVSFKTDPPVAPTIDTRRPESTALTTAVAGGTIVNHGGGKVTSRGVVWGSTAGFDYRNPDGKFEQTGYGEGEFSVEMTGLIPGTKYYVRAFADNGSFKGYGPEVEFTQADYPALTTRPASAKTNKTITTGGVVSSTGYAPLLHTGMVWSTEENFDPKTEQINRILQNDAANFTTVIAGLRGGTDYYVSAFAENVAGISYGQKVKIQTLAAGLADVITTAATEVTGTTAKTGGNILDDGGSYIITRGIAYTENKDLEPKKIPLANKVMQSGSAIGPFITYLSGLKENTVYYIRAFAVNGVDTTYGDQKLFRTQGRPIVTIDRTSSMVVTRTGTAVVIDARIVDDGRAQMLGHGIVWSTTSGPTIDLPTKIAYNRGQIGSYQAVIDGLQPATEYFVRGYGINTVGLNYGNIEFHFETPPITPPVLSVLSVDSIDATKATAVAEITENGGSWVSERGFIWSNDIDFDPRDADEDHKIRLGEDIGRFEGVLNGLKPGQDYYVWAYAINSADTKYSDRFFYPHPAVLPKVTTNPVVASLTTSSARGAGRVDDTGGSSILATGLVWSTTFNFNPEKDPVVRTDDGGPGPDFTGIMEGLTERVTYYVRAYATNDKGTAYGKQVSFCLFATAPELTTISVQDVLGRSANVSGSLVSDGGMAVSRWGFVYSTDKEPDYYKHPKTEVVRGQNDPVFERGNISGAMVNLLPNTQYYVRAYAINLAGVGYGVPIPFLTADYPTLTEAVVHQIGTTTATIRGKITHNGRLPIIKRGVVWSLYDNPDVNRLGKAEEALPAGGAVEGHGEGEFLMQVTGLEPEKTYYAKAYGVNDVGEKYSVFVKFKTNPITSPSIETIEPANVTPVTADPGGNVTDNGGADVTLQGILYHTDSTIELDFDNAWKTVNNGSAQFSALLNGLQPGTKYYYRAYAYNGYKYGYGEKKDFTTPAVPPTLGEVTISDIQSTSVKATAAMIHDGGDPVTQRGFIWTSQTSDPTIISNEGFTDDMTGTITSFSHTLTPLEEGKVYRVRAYARNGVDVGYGPVEIFTICPPSITRYHAAGHNGAAATLPIEYEVVSSDLSGEMKCWIGRNLGASTRQNSATDSRPEAAGWYWQFNRLQGYVGAPTSTAAISEEYQWLPQNDPCSLLLGEGWRLPSASEYTLVRTNWASMTMAYNSDLKLHAAGYAVGSRKSAGAGGYYWSSTSLDNSNGNELYFDASKTMMYSLAKSSGASVRCLQDRLVETLPSVSKVVLTENDGSQATGTAVVTLDGGSEITDRGFIINLSDGVPDIENSLNTERIVRPTAITGAGLFTQIIPGLEQNKTYYLWAFARNGLGYAYSQVEMLNQCPPTITRYHVAGHNGAAETKRVVYEVVSSRLSGEAKCWIGRNLGASEKANGIADGRPESAGWYWQFNSPQGYLVAPSSSASNGQDQQWIRKNDPCELLLGEGWRLPTSAEFTAIKSAWTNQDDIFNSDLRLHLAGYTLNGSLSVRGSAGYYWSSTQFNPTNGNILYFKGTQITMPALSKNSATPVRCLKEATIQTVPSVSKPTFSEMTTSSAKSTAYVTIDGESDISDVGFIWNSTGLMPDLDQNINVDNIVSTADITNAGPFSDVLTGLNETSPFYVWAYARNSKGVGYSARTQVILCPATFKVPHVAGHNGAPETTEITYHSVYSTVSGKPACWLTQDLGAANEPADGSDKSQGAMGWFWQYNNKQAYRYDIATSTTAPGSYSGTVTGATWAESEDPCRLLIGNGWRMPTAAEWAAADDAPQNWSTVNDAYQSGLKIHSPGFLSTGRVLSESGTRAGYWTNASGTWLQVGTAANSATVLTGVANAHGFLLRCLRESIEITPPSVTAVTVSDMSLTDATISARVVLDGGDQLIERGIVWNATGDPTVESYTGMIKEAANATGDFSFVATGLKEGYYYFRAWARNGSKLGYGPAERVLICAPSINRYHIKGTGGAPRDKEIEYKVIGVTIGTQSNCWIAQNLGASVQAGSENDANPEAAGWYWQFNRSTGFESGPASTWNTTYDKTHWGAPDPCTSLLGGGWRLPTNTEWSALVSKWPTMNVMYSSGLKIHAAGWYWQTGVNERGSTTRYWSSTSGTTGTGELDYYTGMSYNGAVMAKLDKKNGAPMRCLLGAGAATLAAVHKVSVSGSSGVGFKAKVIVMHDGGSKILKRGFVWGTSNNPTLASNTGFTAEEAGVGEFAHDLDGLQEGVLYYVKAYVTNGVGTVYSTYETVLGCPPTITRYHVAGTDGAAVTKRVNYKVTTSSLSGTSQCWITQNLGADQEASDSLDLNPASAGWYWQFARKQAFEFNVSRSPVSGWETILINEPGGFYKFGVEPCALLLGAGWRMPTSGEWLAVASKWKAIGDGFKSELRLHAAGTVNNTVLYDRGVQGTYWSSDPAPGGSQGSWTYAAIFRGSATQSAVSSLSKSVGGTIRCLTSSIQKTPPSVTIPTVARTSATEASASATITMDGFSGISERGFVWKLGGGAAPTIADNKVVESSSEMGPYSMSISGLVVGQTYQVRSYTSNEKGQAYGPVLTYIHR